MYYKNYDEMLMEGDILKFHITYNEELKLSELSTCVQLLDKACYKFLRTMQNRAKGKKQEEAVVVSAEKGSFILNVAFPFLGQIGIGLLINCLYDAFKSQFKKKINFDDNNEFLENRQKNKYENKVFKISLKEIEKGFVIDIHINNRDFNWR